VGPEKPLGYLPIDTIINVCKENPQQLTEEAKRKGLLVKYIHYQYHNDIHLYMADQDALEELLQQNADVLKASGWPLEPEKFIEYIAFKFAPEKTKLRDVVSDAFADYTNPGRTDVNDPRL
jgi:hypothetical protein